MSSNNKRLRMSKPSHAVIELRSLPEAKQEAFHLLSDLIKHVETDEDAASLFYLLNESPELARVVDRDGYTLLHHTCKSEETEGGPLEMIRFLVKIFPRALRRKTRNNMLPLHLACENRSISLEVIQVLAK